MPKLHDDIRAALAEPQFSTPYELQRLRGILAYFNPSPSQIDMARDMIADNARCKAKNRVRSVNGQKLKAAPKSKAKAKAQQKPALFSFDGDDDIVPASLPSRRDENKQATNQVSKADYARPLPLPVAPLTSVTVAPKSAIDISTASITAIACHFGLDAGIIDNIEDRSAIDRIAHLSERLLLLHRDKLLDVEIRQAEIAMKRPRSLWAFNVAMLASAELLAATRTRRPGAPALAR